MTTDPEILYRQLGQLVSQIPQDLFGEAPLSENTHRWLGSASVLVQEISTIFRDLFDPATFTVASNGLNGITRNKNAHEIIAVLHRALARAESLAPASAQGAFIPVGAQFDTIQVLSKVLSSAKLSVLIIDPYMDSKVLTDFANLAQEGVLIRLLSDSNGTDPKRILPSATRWINQYGAKRPLELKQTSPRILHDRLIIIDEQNVWALSQSLKDFVDRSPATVLIVDGEVRTLKLEAYLEIWVQSNSLL
jgi:hypothetical protein